MDWNELSRHWLAEEALLEAANAGMLDALIEAAELQPGERVIDIGCGMGASLERVAPAVGAGGKVTGLDIAPAMVARAAERMAGHDHVTVSAGDAASHPFAEGEADAVISLFGLMFFPAPEAAFANIARALRPGGRMVFIAWGPGPANPWFAVPRRVAVSHFPDLPAPDPQLPGPMAFADPDRVAAILQSAGLVPEPPVELTLPVTPPTDARGAAGLMMRIGPLGRLLSERDGDEATRQALRHALATGFAEYETTEGLRVPAHTRIFRARRPG